MQFQADILGVPVVRPATPEITARGAAFLAGLGSGFWSSTESLPVSGGSEIVYRPGMDPERREKLYTGWLEAVHRTLTG
jgi:glycerol kinase